jgi:hypothetical protein
MGFVAGYFPDGRDYPGGSVFLSYGEASQAAPDGYGVYGLLTDLGNTHIVAGSLHLRNDAELVQLDA